MKIKVKTSNHKLGYAIKITKQNQIIPKITTTFLKDTYNQPISQIGFPDNTTISKKICATQTHKKSHSVNLNDTALLTDSQKLLDKNTSQIISQECNGKPISRQLKQSQRPTSATYSQSYAQGKQLLAQTPIGRESEKIGSSKTYLKNPRSSDLYSTRHRFFINGTMRPQRPQSALVEVPIKSSPKTVKLNHKLKTCQPWNCDYQKDINEILDFFQVKNTKQEYQPLPQNGDLQKLKHKINDLTQTIQEIKTSSNYPTSPKFISLPKNKPIKVKLSHRNKSQLTTSSIKANQQATEKQITVEELLSPELVEVLNKTDEPTAIKISKNLFHESQYSGNHLMQVSHVGKTYLFQDERAGVVIADRGPEGGSKFRHIIQEHDRLRRVRAAQDKLLKDINHKHLKEGWANFPQKPQVPLVDKWVASKNGYTKIPQVIH